MRLSRGRHIVKQQAETREGTWESLERKSWIYVVFSGGSLVLEGTWVHDMS